MGQLNRCRDAIEEAARTGQVPWALWVEYHEALAMELRDTALQTTDRCKEDCERVNDFHGAAVARTVREALLRQLDEVTRDA